MTPPTRLSRRHAITIVAIGLVTSLVVGLVCGHDRGPAARIDHAFLDAFVDRTARDADASRTVVVDIDDVSLSAVGQWPWPRYRVAALIQRIAAARPAAIGLDVLFPEPDRSSLANIREAFHHDFGVDLGFTGVPDGLDDNDGFLGEAIASAGVVGGHYLYFDHTSRGDPANIPGVTVDGRTDLLALDRATGVLVDAPGIGGRTRTSGFVNERIDDDGALRRMPLLLDGGRAIHPSLALATVMRALGERSASVERGRDGPQVRVGDHRIPIDARGDALLHFGGDARRYAAIPAVDVLAGRVRPEDLAGRVVFIGSSAVGLNDLHKTAVDGRFPGLKLHAVMAEDILGDEHLRAPSWAPHAVLLASLAAGLAMSLLFARGPGPLVIVAGSAALGVAAFAASAATFVGASLFVAPTAPLVTIGTLFGTFFAMRFAIEKRRALRWQRQLENARQVTIESMASVAETRDPETGAHIKRTQHYVKAIALELRREGRHLDLLTDDYVDLLFLSAPLHDIGKVGVPDHILLKPGKLTPDEFEIMKKHADFGRDIIVNSAQNIDGENFLRVASEIAATHHEKWDGSGYPRGLAGDAIPLSGRIMAVADVYDALISRRCYKEPFTHAVATALMKEADGTMFDPAVLGAFFAIESSIREIATRYQDEASAVVDAPTAQKKLLETMIGTMVGA